MSVMYIRGEDGKFYPVSTIKGEKGDPGNINELPAEIWSFELEDGTTVEKQVIVK